jgi:flagellar basal body-associated protein FliL
LHSTEKPTADNDEELLKKKKKKKIFIGVMIALFVVGIVLAIALPLSLRGGDDPIPDNPQDPFIFQEFKPFLIDKDSVVTKPGSVSFNAKQVTPTQAGESLPSFF